MIEPKVLVLDDDVADCKLVRRFLRHMQPKVTVVEAHSAAELERWEGDPPDVVFVDYLLPQANGLELTPKLLARWPGAGIVMLTGKGDEEIAKSAIQAGAVDYVAKQALSERVVSRIVGRALEKAKMEARIRAQREELEVFADVLVHDLKAPIRAVNFLSGELAECIAAGDFREVQETLRLLQKSARQMRLMVDTLAAHIRIDREAEFERTDLGDLVETALLSLHQDIEASGAEIGQHFEAVPLEGCAPQLAQLLQNVVSNAIKYAGDARPRIEIRTEVTGPDKLRLAISDEGIGIPPEFVGRVFEPFRRAPTTGDVAGSGLGLATCRKIAERHNGRIWCESEHGEGTTVFIELPLAQPLPVSPFGGPTAPVPPGAADVSARSEPRP